MSLEKSKNKTQKKYVSNKIIFKTRIMFLLFLMIILSVIVTAIYYNGHDFTQSTCSDTINSNYEWDECFIGSNICWSILSEENEHLSVASSKHQIMKQALTNFAISKGCDELWYSIEQQPENDKWKIRVKGMFGLDKTFYVNDDGEVI
jgi:uncharacterized protein (UPF0333 family)